MITLKTMAGAAASLGVFTAATLGLNAAESSAELKAAARADAAAAVRAEAAGVELGANGDGSFSGEAGASAQLEDSADASASASLATYGAFSAGSDGWLGAHVDGEANGELTAQVK
ncbi:MAG: hypothetical protein ACRDFQ_07345 [Anaerolineales bacterium]